MNFDSNNIMIYGRLGAGKTTLMLRIVALWMKKKRCNVAYFIGESSNEMVRYFGAKNIFPNADPSVIRNVVKQNYNNKLKTLLIFDDVMGERFHHSQEFNSFFQMLRHYWTTCIYCVQAIRGISPLMRAGIKHFFSLTDTNEVYDYLSEQTSYTKNELRIMIREYLTHNDHYYHLFTNTRDKFNKR